MNLVQKPLPILVQVQILPQLVVRGRTEVGMPRGRFSSLPGLGIHTRLVGMDLPVELSCPASSRRAAGGSDFTPSTQARLTTLIILCYPSYR
jgi:hypothetical protein